MTTSDESTGGETADAGASLALLKAAIEQSRKDRDEAIRQIEELLPRFGTFDLLAYVGLRNIGVNVEHYREGESGGLAIRVEYLTLLTLLSGFRAPAEAVPTPTDYEKVCELLRDVTDTLPFDQYQRKIESGDGKKILASLANSAYLNELFVRIPGQPHHHEFVLRGVFQPFDAELRSVYGFGVDEAIRLAEFIHARCQRVLHASLDRTRSGFAELEALAKRRRHGPVQIRLPGLTDEVLLAWSRLSNQELGRRTRASGLINGMIGIGDDLSFTSEELADGLSLPVAVVEGFLRALSLRFGEPDKQFRMPAALHPLKRKPLVVQEGRYFAPVPDQLQWALQPLFEEVLIKDTALRQRFTDHRHDWLLGEATRLMRRIMPDLTVFERLLYPKPRGQKGDEAELDALARYDSALFLIEAKGASIRSIARKGIVEPFRDEVEKIVQAAHEQALRAHEHLAQGGIFRRSDGSSVAVEMQSVTHVFLLGITLEPLGHLTARMGAENPFAASTDSVLFAISIYDLMMIADCLEGFAPWFPHYLLRRSRLGKQDFMVSAEEMDLFCYYMERGLYHSGPTDFGDVDTVALGTWTDKLDEYYFYKRGLRSTPAPLPRPEAPYPLRKLVERIERSGLPNRLDAMLGIIDLSDKARNDFMRFRQTTRKRHDRDQKPHDFSLAGNGWGITYMTATAEQLAVARSQAYIDMKRRETRADIWVLIEEVGGDNPRFLRFSTSKKE